MNWDSIQLEAKRRGNLVFAIDQNQLPMLMQAGPWGSAYDGCCIGLGATWISRAYHGKDFSSDAGQVCEGVPLKEVTMAQNLSDAASGNSWYDGWNAAVAPFGCHVSHHLTAKCFHKPTADFFCNVVSQAYGCYGVKMVTDGLDAHALAMRQGRDGRFHVFDADYFHAVAADVDKFRELLRWYLEKAGYTLQYTAMTAIIGINPPINHHHH